MPFNAATSTLSRQVSGTIGGSGQSRRLIMLNGLLFHANFWNTVEICPHPQEQASLTMLRKPVLF